MPAYIIEQGEDHDIELDLFKKDGSPMVTGTAAVPALVEAWVELFLRSTNSQIPLQSYTFTGGGIELDAVITNRIKVNILADESQNFTVDKAATIFAKVKVRFLPDADYPDGQRLNAREITVGTLRAAPLTKNDL